MMRTALKSVVLTVNEAAVSRGPTVQTLVNSLLFQRPSLILFEASMQHPVIDGLTVHRRVRASVRGMIQVRHKGSLLAVYVEVPKGSFLEGMGVIHYNHPAFIGVWQRLNSPRLLDIFA